jgi:hypothetical protein
VTIPDWAPLFAPIWIIAVIAISALYRRALGKPVIPRLPKDAIFSERRCSGRSLRTPWARIGGARNCLLVAVTKDELIVAPFFPFNLMFLPEIYDLEHQIGGAAIRDVEDLTGLLGRKIVICYDDRGLRKLELRVRKPDAFIDALRRLQSLV